MISYCNCNSDSDNEVCLHSEYMVSVITVREVVMYNKQTLNQILATTCSDCIKLLPPTATDVLIIELPCHVVKHNTVGKLGLTVIILLLSNMLSLLSRVDNIKEYQTLVHLPANTQYHFLLRSC